MPSLRARLIVGLLMGVTAVIAAGGAFTFAAFRSRMYAEFDRGLRARLSAIAAYTEEDEDGLQVEWLEKSLPLPNLPGDEFLFQVWSTVGDSVISASPQLGDFELPRDGGSLDKPAILPMTLPDGSDGRFASATFAAQIDRDELPEQAPTIVTASVAMKDSVRPALSSLRLQLMALWTASAGLAAFVISLLVVRSLRPLHELSSQIGELDGDSGERRIVLRRPPPSELAPVIDELNGMLERLRAAIRRERTLTSNIAHELRTPVAGILSTLEVALSREREKPEYRAAAAESFEIAKRMHWLINNLLSLARIEAGDIQLDLRPFPLDAAIEEWWQPFEARAAERELTFEARIPDDLRFRTDREFLRVVIGNLLDNAVAYTPRGGTVGLSATAEGRIEVSNPSSKPCGDIVDKVFDPLWRGSTAREEVGVHAGIGLPLCSKIVALLGGTIEATAVNDQAPTFKVTIRLAAAR